MLFLAVVSLWIVFKEKKEPNVVEHCLYNESFNSLLNERYTNTGQTLQPEQYLKNANNVLKELNLVDNNRNIGDKLLEENVIVPRLYNRSFNGVLDERYENEGNAIKYGVFFSKVDYILERF